MFFFAMKYQEDLTIHMLICSRDYEMAIKSIQSFYFIAKKTLYFFMMMYSLKIVK